MFGVGPQSWAEIRIKSKTSEGTEDSGNAMLKFISLSHPKNNTVPTASLPGRFTFNYPSLPLSESTPPILT